MNLQLSLHKEHQDHPLLLLQFGLYGNMGGYHRHAHTAP